MSRILLAACCCSAWLASPLLRTPRAAEEHRGDRCSGSAANRRPDQDEPAESHPPNPLPSRRPKPKRPTKRSRRSSTEWNGLVEQLKTLQKARDAAQGESRAELEQQMAEVRKQTTELIGKISEAGVAVSTRPIRSPSRA